MTASTPLSTDVITDREEFVQFHSKNSSVLLNHAYQTIHRILPDDRRLSSKVGREKMLWRQSLELVEEFDSFCLSQLPCRPILLLDSYIFHYFGKPHDNFTSNFRDSSIHRYFDALCNKAVLSRDALICLLYHLYGLKPREVCTLMGLQESEIPRVYKNFARWRDRGWALVVKEAGLTELEVQELTEQQHENPKLFFKQVSGNLRMLLPFYRKSEPSHYFCLSKNQWKSLVDEGYGIDYRMWHLPFCHGCCEVVSGLISDYSININTQIAIRIYPHAHRQRNFLNTIVHHDQSQRMSPC